MQEIYEIIYGRIDPPLYVPKESLGTIQIGDIIDHSGFYSIPSLSRKTVSFQVDGLSKSHQIGNKSVTTVYATVL